jgi:hypothetical protein
MAEGDTLVNALLGALVNVFAGSFVPFGPLVGGAVAGYLEGGTRDDGLKVGAIAGVIALLPIFLVVALFGTLVYGLLLGVDAGAGIPFAVGGLGIVIFVVFLFGAVYLIGLSALGGYLGNYLKHDTDVEI